VRTFGQVVGIVEHNWAQPEYHRLNLGNSAYGILYSVYGILSSVYGIQHMELREFSKKISIFRLALDHGVVHNSAAAAAVDQPVLQVELDVAALTENLNPEP
jgi:hypothetical protein